MTDALAIVTGSSSGIGQAAANALLQDQWTVVGVSRRSVALYHARYQHLQFDLADLDGLETGLAPRLEVELRRRVFKRLGLVNCAADSGQLRTACALDPQAFARTCAVNVVASAWLMGFLVRNADLTTAVRIVNLSSGAATRPFPGLLDYGASKAALRAAGMVVVAERQHPDLAVLSYEPGLVDTAMQARARQEAADDFPLAESFRRFADEGLLVRPEEVTGEIVEFLRGQGPPGFSERRHGGSPAVAPLR